MQYPHAPRASLLRTPVALLACLFAVLTFDANAALKTVCTITINSADEKEVMQRRLPQDQYRVVELVQRGNPDWLASACRRGVTCDALVISGHFDNGTEFYTDRVEQNEALTVHEMQRASCSASCNSLFSQLKEVYLFGCNTLKTEPVNVASDEILRSLVRSGHSRPDAERVATLLNARYGESNRERLRHVFKGVPVLYGFSSMAPLGRVARPMPEDYFRSAPAGEVAGGRVSPTLLSIFGPSSMTAVPGLTDADPHAGMRGDMCGFADDGIPAARKVAFMHEVLKRDMTEVRMFLDHLERFAASIGRAQRLAPDMAAALGEIERDGDARARYLAFARDADDIAVWNRMMVLARQLNWLTPAQEQAEFQQMISGRLTHGRVGKHEVDVVCSTREPLEPVAARRLHDTGAAPPATLANAAVLACLGDARAHERTVRALTSANAEEAAIAQTYLRHRPLAGTDEVRTLTSSIARMSAASAQARALETLARQRLTDAQSLQEVASLFPLARSLEVQRAIAGILVRSNYRVLARAELARSLRQHRLKSPDGDDIIDVLIRLLQTT
jgi:hypothetical protein